MTKPAINPAYANKGRLTDGPISKHLIRMSLPMTWGVLTMISFQLADLFFISKLGTKELAAISFTMPVAMAVFSLIIGMAIAMSSVLSRAIGEGNEDQVKRLATQGLCFAFIAGLFFSGMGLFFIDPLFRVMGADNTMLPIIDDYMDIWFGGAVFLTMPIVGNAALRATGDTMTPAKIMTVVSVMNVILDPLLIFGMFGFPRLELHGAALATVFANACAMFAGLYMICFKKKLISLRPFQIELFGDTVKRLLFIALPAGITNMIQPLTNAAIISMLAAYGTHAVAAFGIVSRVESFAFVVIIGLAGGMAPIIGQNWGAQNYDRVNETLHKALGFSVLWAFFVAAILGLFAQQIAGLFSDEASVIHYTALYFWIVPITYAAGNLVQGWASAFNALGVPQRAAMMILSKYLIFQIPLAFIGGKLFGVPGIFAGIAATNLLLGVGLHFMNWRRCQMMQQAAPQS